MTGNDMTSNQIKMSDRHLPAAAGVTTTVDPSVMDADKMTYVTFHLADQLFGFRIGDVQEVFTTKSMTRVPLAPRAIRGLLNLRGRVVTAVCLKSVLGMVSAMDSDEQMAIGVERGGETFAFLVDRVGEVIELPSSSLEIAPIHLDADWQGLTRGVHRLETSLLVSLDIERIIGSRALAA